MFMKRRGIWAEGKHQQGLGKQVVVELHRIATSPRVQAGGPYQQMQQTSKRNASTVAPTRRILWNPLIGVKATNTTTGALCKDYAGGGHLSSMSREAGKEDRSPLLG